MEKRTIITLKLISLDLNPVTKTIPLLNGGNTASNKTIFFLHQRRNKSEIQLLTMWHFTSTNSGIFQKSKLEVYTGSISVKCSRDRGLIAQMSLHTER